MERFRPSIAAFIFDTDGVITRTATVHAAAWKQMFDDFLAQRAAAAGTPFVPFSDTDYRIYVDGRARYDGVSAFLESREIALPWGHPNDPPDAETVCGLGIRKNDEFVSYVATHGVEAFESTLTFVRSLRELGIRTAAVSASENCRTVLEAAGAHDLFDVRVDGLDAAALELPGKPDPALFLEAASRLGVEPEAAAIVEDAIAGVRAGRRGGFGLVVGVDRVGDADALTGAGAHVVIGDLAQLVCGPGGWWHRNPTVQSSATLPSALADPELTSRLTRFPLAVFCDYDGTLTPIVARPELAVLSPEMSAVIGRLARRCVIGIVSGRDLSEVRALVQTEGVWLAGSHGFDIQGPGGEHQELPEGRARVPALTEAADLLEGLVAKIPGAWVERKRFAVALHHRQVDDRLVPDVEAAVDEVLAHSTGLRKTGGKRVFELRPDVTWDKGRAVEWLLDRCLATDDGVLAVYLGDDLTDEDAFAALAGRGIGIVVESGDRPTAASYRLGDTSEVLEFLVLVADLLEEMES